MLSLTRRIGETLVIGDNEVHIMILGVRGNQIRLGIDAPESISVHRHEIFQKIKAEEELGVFNIKPGQLHKRFTGPINHEPHEARTC